METASLETAKLLGTGSAQLILAVLAVALGGIAIWLGQKLYAKQEECHSQTIGLLTKTIESNSKLADAIEGSARVTEAALSAMRRPT